MREWTIYFIIFVLIYQTNNSSALSRIDPYVDSKIGLIRGLKAPDGDYAMFLGIPYAIVNNSNPFGASVPHPGFDDVFNAYDTAICPQKEEFHETIVGTLNCLQLNIFVPYTACSRNRLPILVWIHGGGFSMGFSGKNLFGPKYLMKQDIIVVTFNYRLGPYGFMCLDTPEIPGNQGLKDQRLALHWIRNNIDAFGGNPNKITIVGNGAGSASVDFHLTYDRKRFYNQVIMQSGFSLCPWAVVAPDILAPIKLAKQLGFFTTDTNEALKFLSKADPHLLITASIELDLTFRPCIEERIPKADQFIHDYPINIKKLDLKNVNVLLGCTSDEKLDEFETLAPEEIGELNIFYDVLDEYFNLEHDDMIEMEKYLRHFYIGDERPSEKVIQGFTRFSSDFNYNYPAIRTINKYLNNGVKNIFYYIFSYDGGRNFVKDRLNITTPGAANADEIGYLFDIAYMDKPPSGEDQLNIDRMTTMWANFVKYGNPTPVVNQLLPVQWPPVTKFSQNYLHIDSELNVENRNFRYRMGFWDLFYKLNEKYQAGYHENRRIIKNIDNIRRYYTRTTTKVV